MACSQGNPSEGEVVFKFRPFVGCGIAVFLRRPDCAPVVVQRARVFGKKLHTGVAYGLSKAFVIWYTRSLAGKFGTKGARVVSVSPGSFDTAMGQLEKDHGASEFLKVSAIKRFGKPEEIAAVLAFCAGEAPGYLTGTDILLDGGTRAGQEFKNK
jgi:NAD(P)-dependent dehydrogenase (short-subunit alcohol dehydrogenase family)